jgi:hypothetical protein
MRFKKKYPEGTEGVVHIDDIKIPSDFASYIPSMEKIVAKSEYYRNNGMIGKPIIVVPEINERGKPNKLMLVDGYIDFLVMKFYGIKNVPIKYQYEYIV